MDFLSPEKTNPDILSPVEKLTAETTGLGGSMTCDALTAWQLSKVRDAIAYAKKSNPAYNAKFKNLDESKLQCPDDMELVPFTSPEDIIASPGDFVCVSEKKVSRITSLGTSGSTAEPKRIYFTDGDLGRTVRFFARGMSAMVSKGRNVAIMMSSNTPDSIAVLLQKGLSEIGVGSVIHGHINSPGDAAQAAMQTDCIVGVPSEINFLCRTYPELRPSSVLLSSDYVPESVTAAIRKIWHCDVFTHYGMTETGFGCAVSCRESNGHHIRHEDMLIEIVDPVTGRRMGHGQSGEIVITLFANEAMPLFRYRTGDISSIMTEPCACRGILPRLSKIEGRINNAIKTSGGGTVSIEQLDEIIYAVPGIRAYTAELVSFGVGETLSLVIDSIDIFDILDLKKAIMGTVTGRTAVEISFETLPASAGRKKRKIITSRLYRDQA